MSFNKLLQLGSFINRYRIWIFLGMMILMWLIEKTIITFQLSQSLLHGFGFLSALYGLLIGVIYTIALVQKIHDTN